MTTNIRYASIIIKIVKVHLFWCHVLAAVIFELSIHVNHDIRYVEF
jgi:hypothetical protein